MEKAALAPLEAIKDVGGTPGQAQAEESCAGEGFGSDAIGEDRGEAADAGDVDAGEVVDEERAASFEPAGLVQGLECGAGESLAWGLEATSSQVYLMRLW
jgi:hypothetical protein